MSMVSQIRVEVASKFVYILLETEMGVVFGKWRTTSCIAVDTG